MADRNNNYKWYILFLVVLTNMFVIAIPSMGMSVLSKEISEDLGLNLVQVGIIWGVGALPGIVTSLVGGAIGDKIGPKRVLVAGALLGGLFGIARGLADGFLSLTFFMILLGAVIPVVMMNGIKMAGQWFPSHQLGLANGLISMGMAMGFMAGSLFSATVFSPWLGGWRNVLIAYGVIGSLFTIPWLFTRTMAVVKHPSGDSFSMWQALWHVASLKNVWLFGLGLFGIGGAIQGTLGYLPLYLRGEGWQPIQADGALSAFHTVSMIFVLPIALWSDRLGSRKFLLLAAGSMIALGIGMLSFVGGGTVWAATLLSGSMRDAFMAVFLTMVIETDQVGRVYAGTATGFAVALGSIGNVIAPPIGNSLAAFWTGAPFALWFALCILGLVCLSMIKDGVREKTTKTASPS
jgi:MFS family permease